MNRARSLVLWMIVAFFAIFNVLTTLFPGLAPAGLAGVVNTMLLIAFALLHGSGIYGIKGIAVFLVVCLVVANIFENSSILTGFPFGHYHYTDVLGPKLFLVPITIGGAYFGAGYLSWVVAHVLLDRMSRPYDKFAQWAVPVVASLLMTSWDFMLDPRASTVDHFWIWERGGGFFGVPFTNYAGWLLTVLIFFAIFSVYAARVGLNREPGTEPLPLSMWAQPVTMYALLSVRYLLAYFVPSADARLIDASGQAWMQHDINETAALAAVFTIVAFSILAALRLVDTVNAKDENAPGDRSH